MIESLSFDNNESIKYLEVYIDLNDLMVVF
jgi:hypothetical protein